MKLAAYRKNLGRLQLLVIAAPFLSKLFDQHSGIPFPPMGDETTLFRFFAMLIAGASAAIPYVLPVKRLGVGIVIACFCAPVAASALYLGLEQNYVIPIPIAATEKHPDGMKTFVTRGTDRVPDLKEPYASMQDADLISHTGLGDARLERVYTKKTLIANRQKLFWTYVLALASLELLLGIIAKTEQ